VLVLSEEQVKSSISHRECFETVKEAFLLMKAGKASVLMRNRTSLGDRSLSSMGAMINYGEDGLVMAVKVYPTIRGQFSFKVLLIDGNSGEVIASMPGNALTEMRTPATTCVVARHYLGNTEAELTIFGTGIQAQSHLDACVANLNLKRVFVVGIENVDAFVATNLNRYRDLKIEPSSPAASIPVSNLIITATRSSSPLFDGSLVTPGTFIAAIGASKGTVREIDAQTVARADEIVVEWLPQAKVEAGDLILAAAATDWSLVKELCDVLHVRNEVAPLSSSNAVVVYKGIGIGLTDLAIANLAFKKNYPK
jgi:ornithine cyclodeaminase/alanine dehydrogenase-like protein (mu-crystallin family)